MLINNFMAAEYVVSKVKEVTNNAALVKYIENGIKKINGNLKVNVVKLGKYNFGFKNSNDDSFYISIESDKIYVNTNNENSREEVYGNKL